MLFEHIRQSDDTLSKLRLLTLHNIGLCFLFIWACLVTLPSFPPPLGSGLDPSWMYGLNLAHAQRLIFGRDIIFTFGPLAYLGSPDLTIAEPWAVIAFNLLVYSPFVLALWKLATRLNSRATIAAVLLIAACVMQFKFTQTERLQITFLSLMWFVVIDYSFTEVAAFSLAAALAGISLLAKPNDGIVDVIVFYTVWGVAVWRSRTVSTRSIVFALLPPTVFLLLFAILNGSLTTVYPYLQGALELMNGYSEGAVIIGPSWQVSLALTALFVLFIGIPFGTRGGIPFQNMLPCFPLALVIFKHCFIRQDAHAVSFHPQLAATSIFLLVAAHNVIRRACLIGFAVLNLLGGFIIAQEQLPPNYSTNLIRTVELRNATPTIVAYLHFDRSWQFVKSLTDTLLMSKRATPAVMREIDHKSVDDLSWNVDLIRANHWRWHPRPIFQSQTAYTPPLDKANANFLENTGAERITVKWEDIDERNPFLDDTATWRVALNRYDLAYADLDMFILTRRNRARFSSPEVTSHPVKASWNQLIPLPKTSNADVLVMKAIINRSFWGRLRGLFFRVDPIYLEATYESGRKSTFRAIRPNLAEGVIINYLPRSTIELLPLLGCLTDDPADRTVAIRWLVSDKSQFDDDIDISWSKVTITDWNSHTTPFVRPHLSSFVSLWKPGEKVAGVSGAISSDMPDRLIIRPTNLDPQIVFESERTLSRFRTIKIRARFSVSDQINVFFGKQIDGRGLGGYVPISNHWVDIYADVAQNPYWVSEAGTRLRFDPSTNLSIGSETEIIGVWGSEEPLETNGPEIRTYLSNK